MSNKVALVTGAGSGLGNGIARALCKEGYDLALHTGTNAERALALKEELSATGQRVEVFPADFGAGNVSGLFDALEKAFGRLDLCVCNAGVSMFGHILDMTEERFNFIHGVNFKSVYFCVQRAAKLMINAGLADGSIVLISSNQHGTVSRGNSCYSISKESVMKLARHAAVELAEHNIRVNCIAPGFVNTGEARMEGYYDAFLDTIPLRRWVQPEEIARWILFLAGPAAASLTGDTIELDGGARFQSKR